jgi:hypothetical protein
MYNFFEILKSKNEPLYYFGWICLACGVFCFAMTKWSDTQLLGTSAWWKPFKFYISTTFLVWAMAWYMQYLSGVQAVSAYSWGMILLLGFENVYITMQAGRGEMSHFNISTPFSSSMFSLMAFASAAISLWTAYIGLLFFTEKLDFLPAGYLWGIRLGIILFVIFSLQGFSMGARLAHTVGGPDGSAGLPVVNWSKKYGDLRIAHFLGMHALQIIPLVAYYILKNSALVIGFALIFASVTVALFYQALQGKPLVG